MHDIYNKVNNLLLINNECKNYYYVWIKDINKLENANEATHNTIYRCKYCFDKRFLTKERLFNHIENCKYNKSLIKEQLPEEGQNIFLFFKK